MFFIIYFSTSMVLWFALRANVASGSKKALRCISGISGNGIQTLSRMRDKRTIKIQFLPDVLYYLLQQKPSAMIGPKCHGCKRKQDFE